MSLRVRSRCSAIRRDVSPTSKDTLSNHGPSAAASFSAMGRGIPMSTAPSINASTNRKTYAGPLPLSAVAMSTYFSSGTYSSSPSAERIVRALSTCTSDTSGVAVHTVMPMPIWAGVLGMARTTSGCPKNDTSRSKPASPQVSTAEAAPPPACPPGGQPSPTPEA